MEAVRLLVSLHGEEVGLRFDDDELPADVAALREGTASACPSKTKPCWPTARYTPSWRRQRLIAGLLLSRSKRMTLPVSTVVSDVRRVVAGAVGRNRHGALPLAAVADAGGLCCALRVGLDLMSIAVALDAAPVRAIRADPALWEAASCMPPFGTRLGNEELPEISDELLAVVPAGTQWINHFPGRSFQQAEYLLDPVACRAMSTWEQRERSVPYRVVFGDALFAEHANSGQGPRWRCSTASFLRWAAQLIDGLNLAQLRSEFSVAEMAGLGLYKVQPDTGDDEAFAALLGDLRAVAARYRMTVARDLDLIIALH